MIAESQNEVVKKLTVIASLLLLPTFIVGFYGQNFVPAFDDAYWTIGVSIGAHPRVDRRPARALPLAALDLSELVDGAGFVPDVARWDPWTPAEVAERLAALTEPWCVVGGWAIDLFLGRRTREHDDIEVAVGPSGFHAARLALADHELVVVGGGHARPLSDRRSLLTIRPGCGSPRRVPGAWTSSASRRRATHGSSDATRASAFRSNA